MSNPDKTVNQEKPEPSKEKVLETARQVIARNKEVLQKLTDA
jgi:hypothetical protein